MLTRQLKSRFAAMHSESGFTLVETLVALMMGMIVFSALFLILDVTMGQTTRVISRSNATQTSRTALERIENELHSSCIGNGTAPIQPNSDESTLMFVTGTGDAPTVTPVIHTLTFTPGGSTHGTLTDASPSRTDTLLENVAQATDTNGNPIPVFQYFKYQTPTDGSGLPYRDPSGKPYQMLLDGISPLPSGAVTSSGAPAGGTIPPVQPLPPGPLTASDAALASEVLITLVVYPIGTDTNENLSGIGDTVKDGVVLRLTPAANNDNGLNSITPCG